MDNRINGWAAARIMLVIVALTMLAAFAATVAAPAAQAQEYSKTAAKSGNTGKTAKAADSDSNVIVNGKPLMNATVTRLEQQYRMKIQGGAYWYDRRCGAWGLWGGPCMGLIQAGLDLGGKLTENASNGNTGVFVNGRELHWLDVKNFAAVGIYAQRGRWWVDASGNFGREGALRMGNLFSIAQSSGKGGYFHRTSTGATIGSDGNAMYYSFHDAGTGDSQSVIIGP